MKSFFGCMGSLNGRIVRAVVGVALIVLGLALVQGVGGWILAIVGLVPLAAGLLDFCVFAPLFGMPFQGKALREATRK